jgi:hypothetical protein
MAQNVTLLRIVVASPGDVKDERKLVQQVADELNRGTAKDLGMRLEVSRWETDAYPGFHADGPQGLIDPILNIDECDILVGIFWKRFGTPVKDANSGTEHEILRAYEAWQKKKRPHIMVYFKKKPYEPRSRVELDQWGLVLDFQKNFPKEGLWWPYAAKSEFRDLLRRHLEQLLRNEYHTNQPSPALSKPGTADIGISPPKGGSPTSMSRAFLEQMSKTMSNPKYADDLPRLDRTYDRHAVINKETVIIVVGTSIIAELLDRSAAELLRDHIDQDQRASQYAFRRGVVITDVAWYAESGVVAEKGVISVGGPATNKLSAEFGAWKPEPTSKMGSYSIALPAGRTGTGFYRRYGRKPPQVGLWGPDATTTRQAVEHYIKNDAGLHAFLDQCWEPG